MASRMDGKQPISEWRRGLAKRIEAKFPMQKLPDDTREAYLELFTELADEIGRERAEQAINNTFKFCRFFPTEAEIRSAIPAKRLDPWRSPTAEEIAEAEEARKSPEAQKFFALLRKIKTEKRGGNWKQATEESA